MRKPHCVSGNVLSTDAADLAAHVAIDDTPNERHRAHIVHPIADEEAGARRGGGREKAVDFFRPMLAIGIEEDDEFDPALQPVTQAGLDRFAFAAILADER